MLLFIIIRAFILIGLGFLGLFYFLVRAVINNARK